MKALLLSLFVCVWAAFPAFSQPANDHFAEARELVGQSIFVTGSNVGATPEGMEPRHHDNSAAASVWYQWRVSSPGIATVHTRGSTFDTILAVYKGTSLLDLTEVG